MAKKTIDGYLLNFDSHNARSFLASEIECQCHSTMALLIEHFRARKTKEDFFFADRTAAFKGAAYRTLLILLEPICGVV